MSEFRPDHPSGRPIHRRQVKAVGFTRRPPDEPLTPGLQRGRQTYAIGFTSRLVSDEDADE